jgi:hypothetical protein
MGDMVLLAISWQLAPGRRIADLMRFLKLRAARIQELGTNVINQLPATGTEKE